jgi:hypothetical protein
LAEFSRHARGAAFSVIHLKATKAAELTSTVDSGTQLQLCPQKALADKQL